MVIFILFILEGGKLRSHVCEGGDLSAKRGGMPKCGCSTGIFEGNKIKWEIKEDMKWPQNVSQARDDGVMPTPALRPQGSGTNGRQWKTMGDKVAEPMER